MPEQYPYNSGSHRCVLGSTLCGRRDCNEMAQGLPLMVLFGQVFTYEEIVSLALVGMEGIALLNSFFQTEEIGMFFGGTKELGEPIGCEACDDMKELTELYAI